MVNLAGTASLIPTVIVILSLFVVPGDDYILQPPSVGMLAL